MPTEHYTPPTPDQQPQQTGTTFEHGHQIDLHASDLALLEAERARADITAATQPLEEAVQNRLEYMPLTPQKIVANIGRKIVHDLRQGYNENTLDLFNDNIAPAPYITNRTDSRTQTNGNMDIAA